MTFDELTLQITRMAQINDEILSLLKRAGQGGIIDMAAFKADHNADQDAHAALIRNRLTGAITLYVRPDGNDVNDGSANTAAGALKTLAGAWRRLYALDCAGCAVEVKFAPGTYAAGSFSLAGINCFPALSSADANNKAIFTGRLILTDHNKAQLNRLELQGGLTVDHHSIVYASQCHFNFKGPAGEAIIAAQRNSYLYVQDGCSISGTAGTGLSASQNSMINNWGTLTFNNPVFAGAAMSADRLGCIWTGAALAGNATGRRFQVSNAASIDVQGRGPNAIPGTMAGTVNSATLGVYL